MCVLRISKKQEIYICCKFNELKKISPYKYVLNFAERNAKGNFAKLIRLWWLNRNYTIENDKMRKMVNTSLML